MSKCMENKKYGTKHCRKSLIIPIPRKGDTKQCLKLQYTKLNTTSQQNYIKNYIEQTNNAG